jgi:hypothetical protein
MVSMRLGDWDTGSSQAGRIGRWLARGGIYLGFALAFGGFGYRALTGHLSFLQIVLMSVPVALIISTAGVLLTVRSGTYRGPQPLRWWNWLMWSP